MSGEKAGMTGRAAELRRAFDDSFSEAPQAEATEFEDLLAIRVGKDPYAVRLAETAGLFADKSVTPCPSTFPELIGIAGFRGAVVPVYSLRALLGYANGGSPRWLVLAAGPAPVALAFDHFEGHLRVPREAIAAQTGEENGRDHVREAVRLGDAVRPVLRLPSLVGAIAKRAGQAATQKEK